MVVIEQLDQAGEYNDILISGESPEKSSGIGLEIRAEGVVTIPKLDISNVFIGLIHYSGTVLIEELHVHSFGGDGVILRAGNFHVRRLYIYDDYVVVPYDEYHRDAVQAYTVKADGYTLDPDGEIANVTFDEVYIVMRQPDGKGIVGTENCVYRNWSIGNVALHISVPNYYSMMFTNLSDSTIGGGDVEVDKPLRIRDVKKGGLPTTNVTLTGLSHLEHDLNSYATLTYQLLIG